MIGEAVSYCKRLQHLSCGAMSAVPTGLYICRMTAGDFVESRKMLLTK